jgi:hypothetical protein
VVPSHEVFQKPLKVNLQFEDHDVPANYGLYPGGDHLGQTIKVWKVQTKKFPEIDPGMVSDPYGFGDSPDAEVISSGLNGKGPDSVALGRHGNFFLWGFSASPTDMTADGRKCFVNSVCYIKRFDGQTPFVRKQKSGREWALVYAGYLKQYKGQDFLKQLFPEDLLRRFKEDPEKLVAHYRENMEYLMPVQNGFGVDEDVKGLGLSNRKIELLDRCIALVGQSDQREKALRILKRYTNERFTEPREWSAWLHANRDRLFFTDIGGFKFLVAPDYLLKPLRQRGASHSASNEVEQPKTEQPKTRHPVEATVEMLPATARPGERSSVVVRVKIAPPWHIYAARGSLGAGVATTLKLGLPDTVEAVGEWTYPNAAPGPENQMIYEGTVEFRREIRVKPDATAGPASLSCELGYQACDPVSCRPPTILKMAATFDIVAPVSAR